MPEVVSNEDALLINALKTVRSIPLPQVEGHAYNETSQDRVNQAMMYSVMVPEGKMTIHQIYECVENMFDEKMKGSVPQVTMINLINKKLVKVIKPDDPEATENQREKRIFLYEIP